jgi:hypothetical protein
VSDWCGGWFRGDGDNSLVGGYRYDNVVLQPEQFRVDGTTQRIPPPHLDTGQPRINDYHPERYLTKDDAT